MRSVATFVFLVLDFFTSVTPVTLNPGSPFGQVVSAKIEHLKLTVRWNNGFTAIATLNEDQKKYCIFPGYFQQDLSSNVLVTGCPPDDLSVQFQSRIFGDWIVTVNKEGEIIPVEDDYYLEDDEFLINPDSPEVAPISNGVLRSDDNVFDYDDFTLVSPDLNELNDLVEYEIDDENLPSKVELQISVYLDPTWRRLHGNQSAQYARQIVQQASLLMDHSSLNTKIELVHGNRFYNSDTHIKFSDRRQASTDIFINLPKQLKQPFTIGGHRVSHVYLTVPDAPRRISGVAEVASLCAPQLYKNQAKKQPKAIVTWNKDISTSAVTLAHEIGHIFGMFHDFTKGLTRTEPCASNGKGKFILNYKRGNVPRRTVWSDCSNADFRDYYWKVQFTQHKYCLKTSKDASGCDADTQFQCGSGLCIPKSKQCDLTSRDCPAGEDEADCYIDDADWWGRKRNNWWK